jgi:ABC-type glutathione transport system ATPase component
MLEVDIGSVFVSEGNNRRNLLENISFSIGKGSVYTILGKNGSGKSTLIKSLTSLLPNDQYDVKGKVIFQGTDLLSTSSKELNEIRKKNIRYVFQDVVNSLDPLKKLKYYFDISGKKQEQIEEQLNYFLLPSYYKLSGMYSYELSGGMAQRFLIVLALIADPDLLILDEPTSGVDYAVANLILLKLREYISRKDRSVLIVTQDINFALKSSDYISYLSDGSLTKFFTRDELIKSPDDKMKNFINSFKEIDNVSA